MNSFNPWPVVEDTGTPTEWVYEAAGWLLLPVLALAFVALPALDAHTRLLFGRPLTYQTTAKFAR